MLNGPFRLTKSIDMVNKALVDLREQQAAAMQQHYQSMAAAASGGAVGGNVGGGGEHGGGEAAAGGRRSVEWGASETQVKVSRPSRVQWLTSYDEKEMPELIKTIAQETKVRAQFIEEETMAEEAKQAGRGGASSLLTAAQHRTTFM